MKIEASGDRQAWMFSKDELELLVSFAHPEKPDLCGVAFVPSQPAVFSTDGHRLVRWKGHESDTMKRNPVLVPLHAMKMVAQGLPDDLVVEVHLGSPVRVLIPLLDTQILIKPSDVKPPHVHGFFDEAEKRTSSNSMIALNGNYLSDFHRLANVTGDRCLKLSLGAPHDPVLVTGSHQWSAILMPMKLD